MRILFSSVAFVLLCSLSSCMILLESSCPTGTLTVANESSRLIYVYADGEMLFSVCEGAEESADLDCGEQDIVIEKGTFFSTEYNYTIEITGCSTNYLTFN